MIHTISNKYKEPFKVKKGFTIELKLDTLSPINYQVPSGVIQRPEQVITIIFSIINLVIRIRVTYGRGTHLTLSTIAAFVMAVALNKIKQ